MSEWHVYLLRTRRGALYTGIATDVIRRLDEHGRKGGRGAKSLRAKGPLELAYQARIGSRSLALKVERCVKGLTKDQKEELVAAMREGGDLLDYLGLSEGGLSESART